MTTDLDAVFQQTSNTDEKYLGFTSGYPLLAELLQGLGLPRSSQSPLFTSDSWLYGLTTATDVPQLPLPSKASIRTMFEIVLHVITPLFPLFSQEQLDVLIEEVYLNGTITRTNIEQKTLSSFSLAYALALNLMSRKDQNLSSLLLPSVNFARAGFKELISSPSLESLTALMALVLLNHACDLTTPVWYATGSCMSMCIDLNLFEGSINSEQEELRRRLFWTTYSIERGLCLMFGRPIDRLDSIITCPFPASVSQQALDRFKIRRIQSEIMYTMCVEVIPTSPSPEQFLQWEKKITDWFEQSEQTTEQRLQFGNTMLLILRPGVYIKDQEAILRSVDIVLQNFVLYHAEAIEIAIVEGLTLVHDLFLNITTLLYGYVHCAEIRHHLSSMQLLERLASSRQLLLELGRRWRSARENLDLLDAILAALQ